MQLLPSARGAPLAGGRGGRRAVAQQQQQQQQRVVVVSHAAAPRPASALSTARSVPRPAPAVFAPSSSTSSSNGGSSLLSAFVEHESSQGWSPVEDALRTAQQSLRHEEQQQLDRLEEDWSPPTFVTATGRIVAGARTCGLRGDPHRSQPQSLPNGAAQEPEELSTQEQR